MRGWALNWRLAVWGIQCASSHWASMRGPSAPAAGFSRFTKLMEYLLYKPNGMEDGCTQPATSDRGRDPSPLLRRALISQIIQCQFLLDVSCKQKPRCPAPHPP